MRFLVSALLLLGLGLAQMNMDHSKHGMSNLPNLNLLSGAALDRAYLSLMIPHHQGAMDMADFILGKTKDARVKAWAGAILESRPGEIKQMLELLKPLGGLLPTGQDAMKMEMGLMLDDLQLKGSDRAFVEAMIAHHEWATDKAQIVLKKSKNPQVLGLAGAILSAQTQELGELKGWLAGK